VDNNVDQQSTSRQPISQQHPSTHIDDLIDIEQIKQDRISNQILEQHSWAVGKDYYLDYLPFSRGNTSFPSAGVSAGFGVKSQRHRKHLRGKVQAWFTLFIPKVVEFKFALHIRSNAWSSPTVGIAVRSLNVRPYDSPIFWACRECDLERVKLLLESGAASSNDVSPWGQTLLQVC
jgi:hypothetical protein